MPNQPAHSLEQVVAAIQAGHTIAGAARNLHVSRRTMYKYAKRWKAVQEAIDDEREDMLDWAESALKLKVIQGEAWAVCFALRTLGRSRGYAERVEHTGADGKDLIPKRNADDYSDDELAAIIAGRRGASPPEEAPGSE